MLPSYLYLAVALSSSLVSARPYKCDTSAIDDIDACVEPQLVPRGIGEWWEYRNPRDGRLYEEQPDRSRWNPLNMFGGVPENQQNQQSQRNSRSQQTQRNPGSSQPRQNQADEPAVKPLDKIPFPAQGLPEVTSDRPGVPRGTSPGQSTPGGPADRDMIQSRMPGNSVQREGKKTVLYYGNWAVYGRNYNPSDVPVERITHLIYSFAKIDEQSGEVTLSDEPADIQRNAPGPKAGNNLYGSIGSFTQLKSRNRNMKLMLAIGGWGTEKEFASAASTPAKRKRFTESSIGLLSNLGFDGLDIDWEYPTEPQDAKNVVLLLQELRQALDSYAARLKESTGEDVSLLLSFAAPAGQPQYSALPIQEMDPYLDFWNLMTYDFTGSYTKFTGHQAGLYQSKVPNASPAWADVAVQYYKSQNVMPSKMNFGMPLYGKTFADTDGLGEPYGAVGPGSYENGTIDLKDITPEAAYLFPDEEAVASYYYNDETRLFISFDTPKIAELKAKYINDEELGGAMWWMAGGDDEGGNSRVLRVVDQFGGVQALEQSTNNVLYPDSQYENMKNGYFKDRSSPDANQQIPQGVSQEQQPQTQPQGQALGQPRMEALGQPQSQALGQPQSHALGQPQSHALGQPQSQALGQPQSEAEGNTAPQPSPTT